MTLVESLLAVHPELSPAERPLRRPGLLVTPRFRASGHVVWLLQAAGGGAPALVAKLPRLPEASDSLRREAENLTRIHARRPGGFASIPRLLVFESHRGWPILVETGLEGPLLGPTAVRGDPQGACRRVLDWLVELQASAPPARREAGSGWLERTLDAPRARVRGLLELDEEQGRQLDRDRERLAGLASSGPGAVYEHGDLSHPNLVALPDGGLGVLDWELAEPDGLPGADWFFFLTYVAFARARAQSQTAQLSAFHSAFFGDEAWARRWIRDYAERIGLRTELLAPLFRFSWLRCLDRLRQRLPGEAAAGGPPAWLASHRWAALSRHALAHRAELAWEGGS